MIQHWQIFNVFRSLFFQSLQIIVKAERFFLFAFDQFFLVCLSLFLTLLVSRMRLFPLNFFSFLGDVVGFHQNLVRNTHYTFKFNHIYPTYRHAIQRNNLKNKHTNGDRDEKKREIVADSCVFSEYKSGVSDDKKST